MWKMVCQEKRSLAESMRSPLSKCAYLAEEGRCRAVKESSTGDLRLQACLNEAKDSCCYFCSIDNCEIRCDLLTQQESRENRKGSDPAAATGGSDSPRDCGNCIYYLEPECPRAYSRDMELWRRQAPCEIFQRDGGGRVPSYAKARESSKSGRLQEQLQEHRNELNKAYGNYERLEKAIKDLQEEIKVKDETILNLKEQLATQKAKTRETATDQSSRKSKPVPVAQPEPNIGDQNVFRYITDHSGTISLEKAARDLRIPMDELRRAIGRLKRTGRITQG